MDIFNRREEETALRMCVDTHSMKLTDVVNHIMSTSLLSHTVYLLVHHSTGHPQEITLDYSNHFQLRLSKQVILHL